MNYPLIALLGTLLTLQVHAQGTLTTQEFMETPFGGLSTPAAFQKHFGYSFDKQITPFIGPHNGGDSKIIRLEFRRSSVSFFQGYNNSFLLSGTIRNRALEFRHGIKLWMPRKDFFATFSDLTDTGKNHLLLKDNDGFYEYHFYFLFNRLQRVTFQVHPD